MYEIFGEMTFANILFWSLVCPFGGLLIFLGAKEDFIELESGDISWDKTDILVGLIGILQTILYYSGLLIALVGAVFYYRIITEILTWFLFDEGWQVILTSIILTTVLVSLLVWLWNRLK